MRFQWEYVRHSMEVDYGWLEYWHGVDGPGVDREGLEDAARAAASAFQTYLRDHRVIDGTLEAMHLFQLGHLYRLALYHLDKNRWRLAKRIDADVSSGAPRAICIGAVSDEEITVVNSRGQFRQQRLGAYGGCLATFPSNHAAKHWPERWCPPCRYLRQTTERDKAITRLKRREAKR